MKVDLHQIPVRDVYEGYINNQEEGVVGYNGKLDIRPKYQREFVYKDRQRDEVINTVRKGFPLNTMYWVVKDNGNYEVLDGQQRTISICEYIAGNFSIDGNYFHSLTKDQQDKILDYGLTIYFCEGTESEKLEWFQIVNIAGEKLTAQELRNSVYTGPWLSSAKKYFSKTSGPVYNLAGDYLNGTAIRQDYLETTLGWISSIDSDSNDKDERIKEYMSKHQHDDNASELWQYIQNVINWVKTVFPNYRKEMKGIERGPLYNLYHDQQYNAENLESRVKELMEDEDVTKRSGIYPYLITGNEKYLSIRTFNDKIKNKVYNQQKGVCPYCAKEGNTKVYQLNEMEADHIVPWSKGGHTVLENCQMLCKMHNATKGGTF